MSSADEQNDHLTQLIERLIVDAPFRAEFRRDPIGISQAFGLDELAEEFQTQGNAIHTLELRESKSSLAGVVMAIAAEGIGLAEVRGMLGHGAHGPGQAAALKALKGVGIKTPHGGAAGIAKAAGLHGVPGAGAHGRAVRAVLPNAAGAEHAAPNAAAPAAPAAAGPAAPVAPAAPAAPAGGATPEAAAGGAASGAAAADATPAGSAPSAGAAAATAGPAPGSPAAGPAPASPAAAGACGCRRGYRPVRRRRRRRRGGGRPTCGRRCRESTHAPGRGQRGAGTSDPCRRRCSSSSRGDAGRRVERRRCCAAPGQPEPVGAGLRSCAARIANRRSASGCRCSSNAVSHHTIVLGDAESVVDPVHAQAIDIVSVDGQPVGPANVGARDLITEIAALDPSERPNEIVTPWAIRSPGFFTDARTRIGCTWRSSPARLLAGVRVSAGVPATTVAWARWPDAQRRPGGPGRGRRSGGRDRTAGCPACRSGCCAGPSGAGAGAPDLTSAADPVIGTPQGGRGGAAAALAYARSMVGKLPEIGGNNSGRNWTGSRRTSAITARRGVASLSATHSQAAGLKVPHSVASVASILDLARSGDGPFEKGILPVSAIRPGDLVTFGGTEHVAIVTSVDAQGIHTIAGNTSQSNVSATTYSPSEVTGVVRPKYGLLPARRGSSR